MYVTVATDVPKRVRMRPAASYVHVTVPVPRFVWPVRRPRASYVHDTVLESASVSPVTRPASS